MGQVFQEATLTSNKRIKSGYSLLESLIATLIVGVSIVALTTLWATILNYYTRTGETQEAGQIARAELERCKAFGVDNLPLGTVSGATATYTGAFDTSSNSWSANTQYYDYVGQRVSGPNADGVRYSVTDTITDSTIATTATSYGFTIKSRRAVVVTVTVLPAGKTVVTMGTNIVKGGL